MVCDVALPLHVVLNVACMQVEDDGQSDAATEADVSPLPEEALWLPDVEVLAIMKVPTLTACLHARCVCLCICACLPSV